jgi:TRAP-type C4-dicarboxylate transport system permease small subunit
MYEWMLHGFKRFLDILDKVLMALCISIFAVVVTLNAIEIFTRYLLNYSSTVSGEIGLILMTWMYFLGFIILFKRRENVVMEYFFRLLPEQIRAYVEWFTHLVIFTFLAVLVWKSGKFYELTSSMEHPFLPIKYSYTVQPLLVGSILALVVAVYFVLEKTDGLVHRWTRVDKTKHPLG